MKSKRRGEGQEVNAGSMADIAFLLLIFFLVTTTIASDKGLSILLPPHRDENDLSDIKMKDKNVFKVLVNSRNMLLVEDEPMGIDRLRESVKEFVDNRGKDPDLSESPTEGAVSFKTDRGTKYSVYLRVFDEVKAAYHELRAEYLGISLNEYLSFDETESLKDERLIRKAELFSTLAGENYTPKEYLTFNPERQLKLQRQDLVQKYVQARNSGKELFIEKYYDSSREYPLRISEAEPTKVGGE